MKRIFFSAILVVVCFVSTPVMAEIQYFISTVTPSVITSGNGSVFTQYYSAFNYANNPPTYTMAGDYVAFTDVVRSQDTNLFWYNTVTGAYTRFFPYSDGRIRSSEYNTFLQFLNNQPVVHTYDPALGSVQSQYPNGFIAPPPDDPPPDVPPPDVPIDLNKAISFLLGGLTGFGFALASCTRW